VGAAFAGCASGDPSGATGDARSATAGADHRGGEHVGSTSSALTTPHEYLGFFTPDGFTNNSQAAQAETKAYYDTWGASPTLDAFKQKWGFSAIGAVVAGAVYFNAGDLGLGREMHCVQRASDGARSCYVSNYGVGANGKPIFNGDPTSALNDAAFRAHSFATVAMRWNPTAPAADQVQFVVYGPDGNQQLFAQLDNVGYNAAVPFNCLNCHGGSYDVTTHHFTSPARFLPFDIASFKYASFPGYGRADQEDQFRQLNEHVEAIAVAQGGDGQRIADLIDGWYGGKMAVSTSTSKFNDAFVPAGWTGHESVYSGIVAPFCRECHTAVGHDFSAYGGSQGMFGDAWKRANLRAASCALYSMPLAEVPLARFWSSPAPSILTSELNGLPPLSGFFGPQPAGCPAPQAVISSP
jgi:hypothetical protein